MCRKKYLIRIAGLKDNDKNKQQLNDELSYKIEIEVLYFSTHVSPLSYEAQICPW